MLTPHSTRNPADKPVQSLRVLLVLGRVSNLPTVWSNCLAAWLLGGGGPTTGFLWLCAGATLLYTGGMFLNDAFDVEFDRQHRPERPIVSGQIAQQTVWLLATALLVFGLLALLRLGKIPAAFGAGLLALIVVYDAIHKRTTLAPVLMAGCRFLLYLLAASATQRPISSSVLISAAALGVYIVGLSYAARQESYSAGKIRWPIPLLFAPIILDLLPSRANAPSFWPAAAMQGGWVVWCLLGPLTRPSRYLSSGVSGLLAGIVLVDWLAVAGQTLLLAPIFATLFFLALLSQRFAPAT